MPIVRWMRRAALDLDGISKRIAINSPASAEKLLRRMQAKADALAGVAGMGRIGRVPGTRELVVHQNYYLVYRVDGSTIKFFASSTLPSNGHEVLQRGAFQRHTPTYPQLICCVKPFCTLYLPASVWIRPF